MLSRFYKICDSLPEVIPEDLAALDLAKWKNSIFLKNTIQILKPFKTISKLCQGQTYPTLWMVPLWTQYLQKESNRIDGLLADQQRSMRLEARASTSKVLAEALASNLSTYLTEGPENVFALDSPSMKALYLSSKIEFLSQEDLAVLRSKLIPEFRVLKLHASLAPLSSLVNDHFIDALLIALQKDLPSTYPTLSESTGESIDNPLEWWKIVGTERFPFLAELARVFLAIPATSAPSESVFSRAGFEDRTNRARLGAETLRTSLLVVRNMHLLSTSELVTQVCAAIQASSASRKRINRPSE